MATLTGMSDERRVIGYDVGVGGDGGPVYARADGAGEGAARGLPAGCLWHEYTPHDYGLDGNGKSLARVRQFVDGWRWGLVPRASDVTEWSTSMPFAAAQHCAEEALWRVDGFGVGEVRGVLFRMVERAFRAEALKIGAVKIPGLSGLWSVTATRPVPDGTEVDARRVDAVASGDEVPGWGLCSAHRKPVAGCRICDLGLVRTMPEALEKLGVKKRVDARPAGDEVAPWQADGTDEDHAAACGPRIVATSAQMAAVQAAIATPDSEGSGASATDDAVGLVHEPFVPSAKAAAETVEVLRRAEEGDAAELARLLPVLPGDIAGIRSLNYKRGRALFDRVARAAELLTRERDRAHDILRPHHAPTRDGGDMLATLARIVAERSSLRDDRSAALRNVNARNIELTDALGAAEEERDALLARVTDLESALDTAAGSLDGRDDERAALLARVAELEAMLAAPPADPVGKVVAEDARLRSALTSIASYADAARCAEDAATLFDIAITMAKEATAALACDAAKGGDRG